MARRRRRGDEIDVEVDEALRSTSDGVTAIAKGGRAPNPPEATPGPSDAAQSRAAGVTAIAKGGTAPNPAEATPGPSQPRQGVTDGIRKIGHPPNYAKPPRTPPTPEPPGEIELPHIPGVADDDHVVESEVVEVGIEPTNGPVVAGTGLALVVDHGTDDQQRHRVVVEPVVAVALAPVGQRGAPRYATSTGWVGPDRLVEPVTHDRVADVLRHILDRYAADAFDVSAVLASPWVTDADRRTVRAKYGRRVLPPPSAQIIGNV